MTALCLVNVVLDILQYGTFAEQYQENKLVRFFCLNLWTIQ